MKYEAVGIVKEVGTTQTFPSGFSKREAVIDIAGNGSKWANEIPFQVIKDKCSLLDGFSKGDNVKVTFVLNGRSYEGKKGLQRFVDVKILSLEKISANTGSHIEASDNVGEPCCGGDDELPF